MTIRKLRIPVLMVLSLGGLLAGAWGTARPPAQEAPSQPPEPYIEVSSVVGCPSS